MADEEVDVEICCDAFADALEGGGIQVVETTPATYMEVIADASGDSGIAINFCPFCGQPRSSSEPDSAGKANLN
jgi:hypothetical protein